MPPLVDEATRRAFAEMLKQADEKLGSRKAVLLAMPVSRQRIDSFLRDGPPLRPERLLRLALTADIDPSDVLRAGGRAALAELLDRAYDGRFRGVSASQRTLLRAFEQLGHSTQRVVVRLVAGLAAR